MSTYDPAFRKATCAGLDPSHRSPSPVATRKTGRSSRRHRPPACAPAAAPTASITADPLAIDLGQSVVLNWRTQNATVVTIDGIGEVPANGTQTVSPSSSTNFHLTAKGDGGTTEANVRVTVRVPVAPTAPAPETGDMTQRSALPARTSRTSSSTSTATTCALTPPPQPQGRHLPHRSPRPSRSSSAATPTSVDRPSTTWPSAKTAPTPPVQLSSTLASPANRLRVISFGKEKQFCTESNEACWQQNRRAQFSIDR